MTISRRWAEEKKWRRAVMRRREPQDIGFGYGFDEQSAVVGALRLLASDGRKHLKCRLLLLLKGNRKQNNIYILISLYYNLAIINRQMFIYLYIY